MEISATLEIKDILKQNYHMTAKTYMSYAFCVLITNTHGFKCHCFAKLPRFPLVFWYHYKSMDPKDNVIMKLVYILYFDYRHA